jgi:hypothetical protein
MRKGLGILAVMTCGFVASAAGCKFGTDHKAAVEKTVGELFEQIFEIKPREVACPGEDKKVADGDHVCTVTTVESVVVEVNVNVKGSKVFVKPKDILSTNVKLAPGVSEQLPAGSGELTCKGKSHFVIKQGVVVQCATPTLDVRVEFKDAEGNYRVTWGPPGSNGVSAGGPPPSLPTGDAPFEKEAGDDEPADD